MKTLLLCVLLGAALQGCSLVRSITGSNVDHERYARAREAASLELRHRGALQLADRLTRGRDPFDADLVLQLRENVILRMLQTLRGRVGWIDRETRYRVDSLVGDLHPGSAFVALHLLVHNEGYGVDVHLVMDCEIALLPSGDHLVVEFEPYNVSPDVAAGGVLSVANRLIEDVIRVKLGTLRDQFPPLKLPLRIDDAVSLDGSRTTIRGTPNLEIIAPRRLIRYRMRVADVLLFDRHAIVAVDLEEVEAK